jgi:hypothetical protein
LDGIPLTLVFQGIGLARWGRPAVAQIFFLATCANNRKAGV